MDIVPINPDKAMPVRSLIDIVKSGKSLLIFPEGRLTTTGTLMKEFKGYELIARKAGATIVPVYQEGLEQLSWATPQLSTYPKKIFPRLSLTATQPLEFGGDGGKEKKKENRRKIHSLLQTMPVAVAVGKERNLFQAIRNAAEKYGYKRIIMEDPLVDDNLLTYDDLLTRACAIGEKMMPHTQRGEAVGYLMANSNIGAVGFCALQSAARVPVMMHTDMDTATLSDFAKTAGVKTIVTSRDISRLKNLEGKLDELRGGGYKVLYLEDLESAVGRMDRIKARLRARGHMKDCAEPLTADEPAVIAFAAGAEDEPKCLVFSSRNILSNIAQVRVYTPYNPSDKLFNAMPLSYPFGLNGGLMTPLLNGMYSFQAPSPLDTNNISGSVYFKDITIMLGTDMFLRKYAEKADSADFAIRNMMIFSGGERSAPETHKTYYDTFTKIIMPGYGVAEAGPTISLNVPGATREGTAGRVLPDIEYKIDPVEGIAEGGRLSVRGPNVVMGTIGRDNPGIIRPRGNDWLDTGDIVSIDKEGYLTHLGRESRLVKMDGRRVFLEALEDEAKKISGPGAYHVAVSPAGGGRSVVFFPEGQQTQTGAIMKIFAGTMSAVEKADAFIVPVHLKGLEHTELFFGQLRDFPKRLFPRLGAAVGVPEKPLSLPDIKPAERKALRQAQLERMMKALPLLSVEPRQSLMDAFHASARNFGPRRGMFNDPASHNPSYRTTYRDIFKKAHRLGEVFAKSTGKGENVGFLLPNGTDALAAFLGLHSRGRVTAALDPADTAEDFNGKAALAGLQTLVTSHAFVGKKKLENRTASFSKVIYIEDAEEAMPENKEARFFAAGKLRPHDAPEGKDPALIFFSPDKSGALKAAIFNSTNILASCAQLRSVLHVTPEDRVLNAVPLPLALGFVGGMILPALNGVPSVQYPDPEAVALAPTAYLAGSTLLLGTKSLLKTWGENASPEDFSRLRHVFAGGGMLDTATRDLYTERFRVVPAQGCGTVERGTILALETQGGGRKGSYGRLLPGVEARTDEISGHLQVRGSNIAETYLVQNNGANEIRRLHSGAWLDTGIKGFVDNDGFVFSRDGMKSAL